MPIVSQYGAKLCILDTFKLSPWIIFSKLVSVFVSVFWISSNLFKCFCNWFSQNCMKYSMYDLVYATQRNQSPLCSIMQYLNICSRELYWLFFLCFKPSAYFIFHYICRLFPALQLPPSLPQYPFQIACLGNWTNLESLISSTCYLNAWLCHRVLTYRATRLDPPFPRSKCVRNRCIHYWVLPRVRKGLWFGVWEKKPGFNAFVITMSKSSAKSFLK